MVSGSRRYLLDTNILSDLIRHPQGIVAKDYRCRRGGRMHLHCGGL
jgi:predicted nucleic acid-binding protein